MITYQNDNIKIEYKTENYDEGYVQINDKWSMTYRFFKNLCESFPYIEEMRKVVNGNICKD